LPNGLVFWNKVVGKMLNHFYKLIANRFSPCGANAKLSIMIYHRVLPVQDAIFPNQVTRDIFDAQMTLLQEVFNVLTLGEAVERLKMGTLPARAVCITFDDGYADNAAIALPILQRHGLTATFFIATDYLNGGRMFNDTVIEAVRHAGCDRLDLTILGLGQHDLSTDAAKAQAITRILSVVKYFPRQVRDATVDRIAKLALSTHLPDNLMMMTAQLKQLHRAGMEIGAHTAHHPILAQLSRAAAKSEILAGQQYLEKVIGEPVRLFAYPNGAPGVDFLPENAMLVRELGFVAAVSTQSGVASQSSDFFQLPRFTPWRANIKYFVPELLNNLRNGRHAT